MNLFKKSFATIFILFSFFTILGVLTPVNTVKANVEYVGSHFPGCAGWEFDYSTDQNNYTTSGVLKIHASVRNSSSDNCYADNIRVAAYDAVSPTNPGWGFMNGYTIGSVSSGSTLGITASEINGAWTSLGQTPVTPASNVCTWHNQNAWADCHIRFVFGFNERCTANCGTGNNYYDSTFTKDYYYTYGVNSPSVSISADSTSLSQGGSTNIHWLSDGTSSCAVKSYPVNNPANLTTFSDSTSTWGDKGTGPLTTSTTYYAECIVSSSLVLDETNSWSLKNILRKIFMPLKALAEQQPGGNTTIISFVTVNVTIPPTTTANLEFKADNYKSLVKANTATTNTNKIGTSHLSINVSNLPSGKKCTLNKNNTPFINIATGLPYSYNNILNTFLDVDKISTEDTFQLKCDDSANTPSQVVTVKGQSGTLAPASGSNATCIIPAGGSSCTLPLTWATTNSHSNSTSYPGQIKDGIDVLATASNGTSQNITLYGTTMTSGGNSTSKTLKLINHVDGENGSSSSPVFAPESELATLNVTVMCAAPTIWNNNMCTSGTAGNLTATDCIIEIGDNSCSASLNWTTTNPISGFTSAVTSDYPSANTIVSTGNTGTNFSALVPYSSRNFILYHNNSPLDTATAHATCKNGSTWDGSECQASASMTGTLTGLSCEILLNQSSCSTTLSWGINKTEAISSKITSSGMSDITLSTPTIGNNYSGTTSATVVYPNRIFFLYNNAKSLVPVSPDGSGLNLTANCRSGLIWSSGRCIAGIATSYTITSSAGAGGSISPNGNTSVISGNSQQYTFTPNYGYSINNVSVDDHVIGSESTTYTFTNVIQNHTIDVSFIATNTPSGTINATSCVISVDESNCNSTVNWTTANLIPNKRTAVTKNNPSNTLVYPLSSTASWVSPLSISNALNYGPTTFYLYHQGYSGPLLLSSVSVDATCERNSIWNGRKCTPDSILLPNLKALEPNPTSIVLGQPKTFGANIKNHGNASTGVTFKNLFQTSTNVSDPNNPENLVNHPTAAMAILGAGVSSLAISDPITFKGEVPHYIRACADKDGAGAVNGVVTEGAVGFDAEGDNCSAWVLLSQATPEIDLVASMPNPSTVQINIPTIFNSVVTNQGNSSTEIKFSNLFQTSTDISDLENPKDLMNYTNKTPMAPLDGLASAIATSPKITFEKEMIYYIRACADRSSQKDEGLIKEIAEDNNCSNWTELKIVLDGGPDLKADAPILLSSKVGIIKNNKLRAGAAASKLGENIIKTFALTVRNPGTTSTLVSFPNLFQISESADGAGYIDYPVENKMKALEAGESGQAVSSPITMIQGHQYFMRACADKASDADEFGDVTEFDETNNCSDWGAGNEPIVAPGGKHLIFSCLSANISFTSTNCAYILDGINRRISAYRAKVHRLLFINEPRPESRDYNVRVFTRLLV